MIFKNMVISTVSPVEAKDIIDASGDDALLLDVRTKEEYARVRIPGSTLIPVEELQKRCNQLDRKKRIVVYCASGNRSLVACRILELEGFSECINVRGGIGEWIAHGLSVE